MIIDKLENQELYHFGPGWKLAFEFLNSLTVDAEEKKYTIQGDDIFARVMRYETRLPEDSIIESHREYIDLQVLLKGRESIEYFARDGLTVDSVYDQSDDAELYKRTGPGSTRIDLSPGSFVALFPDDAHMPSLMTHDQSEPVVKVVIKIKVELLTLECLTSTFTKP
jgi:YhcH/YjgK/YiaL family protein